MSVLYLCDRKACGENHKCGECSHTSDIVHAKNFEKIGKSYFEKEHAIKTMNEIREEQGLSIIDGGDVVLIKDGMVQQIGGMRYAE